jgi:hypothetical protein
MTVEFIIAAYGALLSTFLAAKELIRSSRGITVQCRVAVADLPEGGKWQLVVVKAVNKRPRPVTITESGLRMRDGRFFTQGASRLGLKPLPTKLDFGDMVEIPFDLPELEKLITQQRSPTGVPTRAFVRDAQGKEYTSRLPRQLTRELENKASAE